MAKEMTLKELEKIRTKAMKDIFKAHQKYVSITRLLENTRKKVKEVNK